MAKLDRPVGSDNHETLEDALDGIFTELGKLAKGQEALAEAHGSFATKVLKAL